MVDYREDAFQRIVNVGWPQNLRYIVKDLGDNSSENSPADILVPHNCTYADISAVIGDIETETNPVDFFYSTAPAITTLADLNTINKRKALIDLGESYVYCAFTRWESTNHPGTFITRQAFTIFFVGKYILDHPNTLDFFFRQLSNSTDLNATRPDQTTRDFLVGAPWQCRDYAGPLGDLDGGPHNIET